MTTKRDILEICCKVLGLVCLIRAVAYIPHIVCSIARAVDPVLSGRNVWWLPETIATLMILIVSAFFLLKYSKGIASLLVREDGPVQINMGENWQSPLYTLCLRVVGAVALVKGIPELIRIFPVITFRQLLAPPISPNMVGQFLSAIAYLILGIYFIGGAKLVVRIALKGSMRE